MRLTIPSPTYVRQIIVWPPRSCSGRLPEFNHRCLQVERYEDGKALVLFFDGAAMVTQTRDEQPITASDFIQLRDTLVGKRYDEIGEAELESFVAS